MMGFLKTFKFLFYSFTFEKLWTFTIYVHITIIDNENQMGHPQIIIVPWKVSHILLINIHVFAINVNVDNYMKYLCNRYITLNKLVLFYCGTLYKEQTVISRDDCKGKLSMVCEKDWGISIYKYIWSIFKGVSLSLGIGVKLTVLPPCGKDFDHILILNKRNHRI